MKFLAYLWRCPCGRALKIPTSNQERTEFCWQTHQNTLEKCSTGQAFLWDCSLSSHSDFMRIILCSNSSGNRQHSPVNIFKLLIFGVICPRLIGKKNYSPIVIVLVTDFLRSDQDTGILQWKSASSAFFGLSRCFPVWLTHQILCFNVS